MKTVSAIQSTLKRRLETNLRSWLIDPENVEVKFSLGVPTEKYAHSNLSRVVEWTREWKQAEEIHVGVEVEWVERYWRIQGKQTLPAYVQLTGLNQISSFIGQTAYIELFRQRAEQLSKLCVVTSSKMNGTQISMDDAWKISISTLVSMKSAVRELPDSEWIRSLKVSGWIVTHPNSGLPIRTLPIAGMDTKWLERHQGIVAKSVLAIRTAAGLEGAGELGLAPRSEASFLVVWCDPDTRPCGIKRAELPVGELAKIEFPGTTIICENLETAKAMEGTPGVLCIHGGGRRVAELRKVPWLTQRSILYWGDLDSHGFEILALLRRSLSDQKRADGQFQLVSSVLMDSETLLQHRDLWVPEPVSDFSDVDEWLTSAERSVLSMLHTLATGDSNRSVRLEQERVAWNWALPRLRKALEESSATEE